MKSLKNLITNWSWKEVIPKIEADSCILLNGPGDDYLLAWEAESTLKVNQNEFDFKILDAFLANNEGRYIFGYFGYDIKNKIEPQLKSQNEDLLKFPDCYLMVPKHVLISKNGKNEYFGEWSIEQLTNFFNSKKPTESLSFQEQNILLTHKTCKSNYLETFDKIKSEIQFGNIYEINYCINFFAEQTAIHSFETYLKLCSNTDAPFSCYFHFEDYYALSASPERYLKKTGNQLMSQPIKGTAARGATTLEDEQQLVNLKHNPKEQAENVMIVDLVRNDLSKIASKNSVQVDELFGVHTFKTVHQLISTVSCELRKDVTFSDIIKATFPMGSMTGAPKIKAMELSEKFENFKRGLYSGTIGYIQPNGDFDFNVVIRSILHNQKEMVVSCSVGGAITINALPEQEFQECLLKLSALEKALC